MLRCGLAVVLILLLGASWGAAAEGAPGAAAGSETSSSRPSAVEVALTFDDIPAHGFLPPGKTRDDVARAIIDALTAHHAPPAYAFLNAKGLDGAPQTGSVLRLWRDAGQLLGNHTYSHMDLDANTVEAFEKEVLADEPFLRASMGQADWHWFRYPYLHEGDTPEKHRAVAGFLHERGYRIAEVSLSFDDWAYSDPYARCLARDDASAVAWLEQSYMNRAADALDRARAEAGDRAHVMLLHFGGIQIAMLPKLMDLLEAKGFEVVTLEKAQSDPAYARDADGMRVPRTATPEPEKQEGDAPRTDNDLERLSALCR